jgi:hypothetical protein
MRLYNCTSHQYAASNAVCCRYVCPLHAVHWLTCQRERYTHQHPEWATQLALPTTSLADTFNAAAMVLLCHAAARRATLLAVTATWPAWTLSTRCVKPAATSHASPRCGAASTCHPAAMHRSLQLCSYLT